MTPPKWRSRAMVINSALGGLPILQPVILAFPTRERFNFDRNLLADLYLASVLLSHFDLVLGMAHNMLDLHCLRLCLF
jgi:hypothetical protein